MEENKKFEAELSDEELDQAAGGVSNAAYLRNNAASLSNKTTLTKSAARDAAAALGNASAALGANASQMAKGNVSGIVTNSALGNENEASALDSEASAQGVNSMKEW